MSYFQDPGKIGTVTISKNGTSGGLIATDPGADSLTFRLVPDPINPDPIFPLTINTVGIRVRTNLVTNNFQLLTNPGADKILGSDVHGNGTWIDPSSFLDNYWLINANNDLYTSNKNMGGGRTQFRNVGVGTQFPNDLFQVNTGTQKFVIGDASESSFGWGISYLGFNAFKHSDHYLGYKWTIESNNFDNGGSVIYGDIGGNMHFINVPSTKTADTQYFSDSQMLGMTSMTISNNGNVGIGTVSPNVALDVKRDGNVQIRSFSLRGDTSSIWAINSLAGYGLSVDINGMGHIDENPYNPTPIMSFHSGKVGIGNDIDLDSYTDNHLLFVKEGITTEEVTVKLSANNGWSDFVFNKNYKLKSIEELAQYIQVNKHLPDVPTNTDVKKDGIELGKMNAILLQKIEELSFYVIELKKEITELQNNKNN